MLRLPTHKYPLLDGLRGVAALMVILFHIGETFATSPADQMFNHGYLAVDFFFVLSGFVIGKSYDRQWNAGLTRGRFLLHRIIRLQPMVVAGVLIGVAAFVIQGCEHWDGTPVRPWEVALSSLLGLLMIPCLPDTFGEVRGNGEMFPLNGPAWSLFFEYIGSIFYALFLHRLSNRLLKAFGLLSGLGVTAICIGNANGFCQLGVGWTAADNGFWLGLIRMTFSFSMGLLIARMFKPCRAKGAFWVCTAAILALLSIPHLSVGTNAVPNGVYDVVCTLFAFPLIVWLGASGATHSPRMVKACTLLGALSYPLYITHYPFMYLMYAWAWKNDYGIAEVWPVAVGVVILAIATAWLLMRSYDIPLRLWLSKKLLHNQQN